MLSQSSAIPSSTATVATSTCDAPLFDALFEPATRQLQRTVHFLEKVNKTAVLGLTPQAVVVVQSPSAASSAQSVPSWSQLSYALLGLSRVHLTPSAVDGAAGALVVELSVGLLLAVLRSIEQHAVGVLQILPANHRLLILSRPAAIGLDASEMRAGQPGVVMHTLPLSRPLDLAHALQEPAVPLPAISFHLPHPGALRERLSALSGSELHLFATTAGTLQIEADVSLLRVRLAWDSLRLVNSSPPSGPRRSASIRVLRALLLKVLQYTMYLPMGVVSSAVCAIIPDHALVVSLALSDHHLASTAPSLMTFYIPPLSIG